MVEWSLHSQTLILNRHCSSCMNLQELLICLTGAWDATVTEGPQWQIQGKILPGLSQAPDE